ncbi:MAG: transglutaminase domain-containing protein [Bacteroidota bacterium]
MNLLFYLLFSVAGLILLLILIAIPATLALPGGLRPGIENQTIEQAASQLRGSGKQGWDLVKAAVLLVHRRMQYCRRNSFDSPEKAFRRGYGYCQQQAFALKKLLNLLGFQAIVVHAFNNRFPGGKRGNHAWVQVTYAGETRDFCSIFLHPESGEPDFQPGKKIWKYNAVFRLLAGWGSAAINSLRYFQTGKDFDLYD